MATIVLQVAGSAIGGILGGPVGAIAGRAIGALAGAVIDQSLLGSNGNRAVQGPRLRELSGITASEGAPIPRVYGRVRLGGQVIWATNFEESATVSRQGGSGGKGGGSSQTSTTYTYFANVAMALCEGPIAYVHRVFADGKELDLTAVTMRVYLGDESQGPDPLIVARQGGEVPAYRGTAYVVFERLPLANYGNRLPQVTFELVRPLAGLPGQVRALDLIPSSTEFGYAPAPVSKSDGLGNSASENRHQLQRATDMAASLDVMQALLPALRKISLVVAWFGDDLRLGQCSVRPKVEIADKVTTGGEWRVAGLARAEARVVSTVNGRPAYGGTPSDASVIAGIRDLQARGLAVTYYPFVLMDVPAGNGLPDPYGRPEQPPYPWRGRITSAIAPGLPGSGDGTSAVASEMAAFFGSASAADFAVSGDEVIYSGPDEWGFRRHILHNAALAKAAGGVEAFIIGSEMVGMTRLRSAPGIYPAAQALMALAGEVRALLGPGVKIAYAADWTEYGAHALNGGSEVRFPLDPLFAHSAIDAIGIDYYAPITDWRDGADHADAAEAYSAADPAYLSRRIGAGEAFDWYYADPAARAAQIRTPITDGAYNKPWVFRAKDLVSWWQNPHVERVGGVETGATPFVPQAKPIWLTEVGAPAVDRAGNGPNVFPDPKSSESAYPPFSRGTRDDLVQRRFLEAMIGRFDPATPGFDPAHNPVSALTGARMVDAERLALWCWDARPFPAFPQATDVWADGANHNTGHWLTGRIEGCPLDVLIGTIAAEFGLAAPILEQVDGFVDGYVIERPMAARAAVEPLADLFGLDVHARAGTLAFRGRHASARVTALARADLVPDRDGIEISHARAQESELPRSLTIGFIDVERAHRQTTAVATRSGTSAQRTRITETAAALRREEADRRATIALQTAWVARDTARFRLSPALRALEPGDVVALPLETGPNLYQITEITDAEHRNVSARAIAPGLFDHAGAPRPQTRQRAPETLGPPHVEFLELPIVRGEPPVLGALALHAAPWGGPYAVLRAPEGASLIPFATAPAPHRLGRLDRDLPPGPLWRFDRANTIEATLAGGALASVSDADLFEGRNLIAVRGADGLWEVIGFGVAEIVGAGRWRLSRLLRGLGGSEPAAARLAQSGGAVVILDETLVPVAEGEASLGLPYRFQIVPAGRDSADPAATTWTARFSGLALRPLAPVRPMARRHGAGIDITFIRRSRIGGDGFEAAEIPLGEEIEAYEIDIFAAGTLKRTLAAGKPAILYTGADEMSDFGAPQTALSLSIAQMSRALGRGAAFTGTIPIR